MKRRILSISALFLVGVTAFAQPNLDDPRSAKTVYMQGFEQSWEEFTSTKIDEINEIQYYTMPGTGNGTGFRPWEGWEKGPIRRDSIIEIYQGSMVVCDPYESQNGSEIWGDDNDYSATIVYHNVDDNAELAAFGEADEGGNRYFQFTSDTILSMYSYSGSYTNKLAARYRRNLNIHLWPGNIQENSSYRLTFYVKAKTLPGHENYVATPTVYADLMRGYHHSEKPFSMGYVANSSEHPYEYNKTFEYTKNDFYDDKDWDNWEKVTFMAYYTNDSIAENFFYSDGYWWAEDGAWTWKEGIGDNPYPYDLNYIVQPDKYYIRLGFPADYTVYSVDNLSLTNSWIAGCEYYRDKMRIDFGYQTNLAQLVAEEQARTNNDYIQLDNQSLTVWCLKKGLDENNPSSWFVMPLRSVEYHADGFMYAFTQFFEYDGEEYSYQFGDYDKVLVCFQNPQDDPRLTLTYTDAPFPKGDDMEWIQNGKIVPDFVNEVATPNPNPKNWRGVYSIEDLPPVLQEAPYEEGSFGLEPVSEMRFKFSRKVLFDNNFNSTKAIAYVNDERWSISYDSQDESILVITRSNGQPLADGDYTIELTQLYGVGTDAGDDIILHYNFGEISRNLPNPVLAWDAQFYDEAINPVEQCQPEGTALWIPASNSWISTTDTFIEGDGTARGEKCRLYWFAGTKYPRAYNLSARGGTKPASLYLGYEDDYKIHLSKGYYSVEFAVYGVNKIRTVRAYLYPWDETPQNIKDKVLIGQYTPSGYISESDRNKNTISLDDILEPVSFDFSMVSEGDYIVELEVDANKSTEWSGYSGVMISNVTVSRINIGYSAIKSLNTAVDIANARIAMADANYIYGGQVLETLRAKRDFYNYYPEGGFKPYPNNPSEWFAARSDLDTYTKWVKERMDTINSFVNKIADAEAKLEGLSYEYKHFDVSVKLQALIDSAYAYDITVNTGADIANLTNLIDKAMTAVDNRKAKNDKLAGYIEAAQELFDAKERVDFYEYQVLSDTLTEAKAFDAVTAADEAVDAEALKVYKVNTLYEAKVSGYAAMTARNKRFRDIAAELEVEEVDNEWAIKNYVATTNEDNDEIAEIYKAAVRYAIYAALADDPDAAEDGIDLTPFIKNYMLYALNDKPIVDNRDLTLATGNAKNDPRAKGANNPGSVYQWIGHNYGQEPLDKKIWVLMYDTAYAEVFPGWTVQSYITGGMSMVTSDPTVSGEYKYLRFGAPVFDGAVTLDWSSKAQLKQTVTGLPNGYYELAFEGIIYANSSDYKTTLTATTKVGGKDSVKAVSVTSDATKTVSIDYITVLDGTLNIDLTVASNSGISKADNFQLIYLGGHNSINYAMESYYAKAELDALLQEFSGETPETHHDIYMPSASAYAGSQVEIPVRLENSSAITAFSLDVVLPSGVSFVSARLNSSRINDHSLSTNVTSNWSSSTVSLACLSMNNKALYYDDGDVVYLTLQLSDYMEGNYNISFTNKEMVAPDNTIYNPSNSVYTLTVLAPYTPGDVNEDGRISIADAVGVVSFIINSNTNGLNRRAADANQDGAIDVADAVWVVNKVIRKSYAPMRGSVRGDISSTMLFEDVESSGLMSLPVRINGMSNEITALQFDIELPDGVSVSGMTTDDNHMTFSSRLENGVYRVVCLSLNNNTFAGNGEVALSLELSTDGSFAGGEFRVDNAMMVMPDGRKIKVDIAVGRLANDGETGIKGINVDSDGNMYDLQGRQIDRANGIYIRDGKKQLQIK